MASETEVIRRYFSKLGSMKTPAQIRRSRETVKLAQAAKASPVERLEKAFQAVRQGEATASSAAAKIGKCRYKRLLAYMKRREKGETPEQIKENL